LFAPVTQIREDTVDVILYRRWKVSNQWLWLCACSGLTHRPCGQ